MPDALLAPKRGKEGACTGHNNGRVVREVSVIRLTLGSPLCYMSRSALEETQEMYAIIETGGKQYRVESGSLLQVATLEGDVGSTIELDQVRLVHGDSGVVIGQPLVKGAKVTAEIVRHGRTRSITVFKKKRRKNYRRTRGHRQGFTSLRITGIATA